VPSANPVAPSRSRRLGAGDRGTEGALSLVTFSGQAEKVTRSPAGERNRNTTREKRKKKEIRDATPREEALVRQWGGRRGIRNVSQQT